MIMIRRLELKRFGVRVTYLFLMLGKRKVRSSALA
jgi:hypothetical protein